MSSKFNKNNNNIFWIQQLVYLTFFSRPSFWSENKSSWHCQKMRLLRIIIYLLTVFILFYGENIKLKRKCVLWNKKDIL